MADATNTVKVDGVEPSILVNLVNSADSPERVKIFTADDGTERFLVKGADPILVTDKDLSVLGAVPIEIVESLKISAPIPAQNPPVVSSPVINPTPGQSGQ